MNPDMCTVRLTQENVVLTVREGSNLFAVLREAGYAPDTYCGGTGKCGKCALLVNGESRLSCTCSVTGDITVSIPSGREHNAKNDSGESDSETIEGNASLAIDVGTTTVVCALLDENGTILGKEAVTNPQIPYGADVVTRIRSALSGSMENQSSLIRRSLSDAAETLLRRFGIPFSAVQRISFVGNPSMQQLLLGMDLKNLVELPYHPIITKPETRPAWKVLPKFADAELLIVPDISAYVGADTVAGIMATGMDRSERLQLLVDIGTNGEMVLGDRNGMLSCATAAGPALEGADISCGMRSAEGAICSATVKNGEPSFSVIGNGKAT